MAQTICVLNCSRHISKVKNAHIAINMAVVLDSDYMAIIAENLMGQLPADRPST